MKRMLILIITLTSVCQANAQATFADAATVGVLSELKEADGAKAVFSIDMDGDGDIDILSASFNDNKIAWYENDGSQNFSARVVSTNALNATDLYAIDLDNDGDIDVLSASDFDDEIAWYENDGSQNFTEWIITTGAISARSVHAIDVDSDGDIDVLSASSNKIVWYDNNGDQIFTRQIIDATASSASDVFAIDLDGDSDIDVLAASRGDNEVVWYENDGAESFDKHVISTNTFNAQSVFALDLDGDGDVDVLSASEGDDKIAWYENDGNQNFSEFVVSSNAERAQDVFSVDLDSDGDFDILSASFNDNKISWYENDGNQNFIGKLISSSADLPTSVYAQDLDDDGDIDVVSASWRDNKIAWYENDGTESFLEKPITGSVSIADKVFAINMDGDDDIDVLSASSQENKIFWYRNNANDSFTKNVISTTAMGVQSVYAVDMDGDTDTDVLSASALDNKISWYINDGTNHFTEQVISSNAEYAIDVYAADMDGDGLMDILSASRNDDKIAWYENEDDVDFTERIISSSADGASNVIAIDFDADGDMDVLSALRHENKIAWYENDGSQNFTERIISTNLLQVNCIDSADIDGDGDMDVLSASFNEYKVVWYENDGSQNFTEQVINIEERSQQEYNVTDMDVSASDLDGDGDIDFLVLTTNENEIVWYENDGNQIFTEHLISSDAAHAKSIFVIDLNNDGNIDVVSSFETETEAYSYGSGVLWFENLNPSKPSGLSVNDNGEDYIEISWDIASDASEYTVFRDVESPAVTAIASGIIGNSFRDENLIPNTNYSYRIRATNDSGTSHFSDEITRRTGLDVAPSTPVQRVSSIVNDDEIRLTWFSIGESDLDKFIIRRNAIEYDSVNSFTRTWSDTEAERSVVYSYEISARDKGSNYSAYGEFGDISIPPAAPHTEIVSVRENEVEINWQIDEEDKISSYLVYRKTPSNAFHLLDQVNSRKYIDQTILANTRYTYEIIAEDLLNVRSIGLQFNVETGDLQDAHPPNDPQNVSSITGADFITINWKANTENDLAGYQVKRGDLEGYVNVPKENASYTDWDVTAGTSYDYSVASFDENGNVSEWVNISATPFIFETNFSYAVNNTAFPAPKTDKDYRMISLPGNDSKLVGNVMQGEFNTNWKAYYETGTVSEDPEVYLKAYSSSNTAFTFTAGRAFWILSDAGWKENSFSTPANNVALSDESAYRITLHSGWNLIGNPFDEAVPWSSIVAENEGLAQSIWSWTGTGYVAATSMKPYAGYYFYNGDDLTGLDIPHPDKRSVSAAKQSLQALRNNPPASDYSGTAQGLAAIITASSNNSIGQIQFHQNDELFTDQFAPPGHFAEITLRIKDVENHEQYPWLIEKVLASENSEQIIALVLNAPADANVQFNASAFDQLIRAGQSAVLVNKATGKSWNLSETETFGVDVQEDVTDFVLLIGSDEFVETEAASYLPELFVLDANYPNPFASTTQIGFALPESSQVMLAVYDVLGRRIETLVNATVDAGYHTLKWNADGLSNGIYFYRMSAGGFVQTKKMIVLK